MISADGLSFTCPTHGTVSYRGDAQCAKCERIYLGHRNHPDVCPCGAALWIHDGSARGMCSVCARSTAAP